MMWSSCVWSSKAKKPHYVWNTPSPIHARRIHYVAGGNSRDWDLITRSCLFQSYFCSGTGRCPHRDIYICKFMIAALKQILKKEIFSTVVQKISPSTQSDWLNCIPWVLTYASVPLYSLLLEELFVMCYKALPFSLWLLLEAAYAETSWESSLFNFAIQMYTCCPGVNTFVYKVLINGSDFEM